MNEEHDIHLPPFVIEDRITELTRGERPVSWGVNYLEAPTLWPAGIEGAGVIAFVIDTEDSTTHERVAPSVEKAYCRRFTNEAGTVRSGQGHGLHVADTILQVAPRVRIGLLKALTNAGTGRSEWVAKAIRFAADVPLLGHHTGFARMINLSLGSDVAAPVIKEAIEYARTKQVTVFAAAGNDGKDVDYPGAFAEHVITIGAIDENSRPANFSSPGPEVDLAAPGVKVYAAFGRTYAALSGTSMATPHACGVACLIAGQRIVNMERFLKRYAVDTYKEGIDEKTGYGIPIAPGYFRDDTPDEPLPPVDPPQAATPLWVWVAGGVAVVGAILYAILA